MTVNGRQKRRKRAERGRNLTVIKNHIQDRPCMNCGKAGPHYAPPGFGTPGFYMCKKEIKSD